MSSETIALKRDAAGSFSVIIKVHGAAIQLRQATTNGPQTPAKDWSYRISCQPLNANAPGKDVVTRLFVLSDFTSETDNCSFQDQHPDGFPVNVADLAIFMTSPIVSEKGITFTIDVMVSELDAQYTESIKKVGTAYLIIDPRFSSQGVQRMQLVGPQNSGSVGQIQAEYLIVKKPVAYEVSVPLPAWLTPTMHLNAGHRGAGSGCRADLSGSITENTVASFNYAARHGADMCELDVMCTADGIPIVYHNYIIDTNNPSSTQIDRLTLAQLREQIPVSIHDKNCQHDLKGSPKALQQSMRPFPTLEEVLVDVDKACGLNIELKWPQTLNNGKSEANQCREINDYVDRVLKCIDEHSRGRRILLSTLNADIAILLRLKQSHYPVLFLTTGDSQRFHDPITKSVMSAIHFAKAFAMAGINPNAAYVTESLVRYAHERGLLVYAWGKIETPQEVAALRRTGLDGVIYDKIDLIKPQD